MKKLATPPQVPRGELAYAASSRPLAPPCASVRPSGTESLPSDAFSVLSAREREQLAAGILPSPLRGMVPAPSARALRGRGARSARSGRHERLQYEAVDDGWNSLGALASEKLKTEVREEQARSIITRNSSPDVGFEWSVNPYRGCEHGCIYCYARPGHANLGLSPGLDFESRIVAKVNASELFEKALGRPSWRGAPIAIGTYTDAYQPVERHYRLTRRLLEIAERYGQALTIVTKSRLIRRDIDILRQLARRRLVRVMVAVTTLDAELARRMEPRATTPAGRLETIGRLADAGVPTGIMLAPVIPALNDHEIEHILQRAWQAGAREAAMVMLRLPAEIAELFREWLQDHFPQRARKVLGLVSQMHGGRLYDGRFGHRMRGTGPYAWMLWRRYEATCLRLRMGMDPVVLDTSQFRQPENAATQTELPLFEKRA